MARRRRRSHRRSYSAMHAVSKYITPAAFGVSFVGQLTAKDIQSYSGYNALTNTEKLKFLGNAIASRTIGFSPYPQYGTPGFTVNPSGAINKYTGMGLGLLILSKVIPNGVGGKSIAHKVGKGFFWGGIIGGFFDANTGGRQGATNNMTGSIMSGARAGGTGSRTQGFGGTYSG